ncbi:hypothetical protein PHYBOEH_004266 [Phytophthora boehmeriae]|uniref:Uncharacterized protein n=1 Tax=Phytophthora boehmeriae TaxID=109152 RepID=A0A8T1WTH8_9STRA|nr:hypothetical protein PHYBOEH_004266 [Phytophthora boehmeriae]
MNIGKIFAYLAVVSLAVGTLADAADNSHRQLGAGGGVPAGTVSPPTQPSPQQPPTTQGSQPSPELHSTQGSGSYQGSQSWSSSSGSQAVGDVVVGQDSQHSSGSNHGSQPSTELPATDTPYQQSSGSTQGSQPSTELPATDIPIQQSSGSNHGSQPSTELPATDTPYQQSSGSNHGSQSWSSSGSQEVGDAFVGQEDPNDDLTTQSAIQSRFLRR